MIDQDDLCQCKGECAESRKVKSHCVACVYICLGLYLHLKEKCIYGQRHKNKHIQGLRVLLSINNCFYIKVILVWGRNCLGINIYICASLYAPVGLVKAMRLTTWGAHLLMEQPRHYINKPFYQLHH